LRPPGEGRASARRALVGDVEQALGWSIEAPGD